MTSNLFIAFIVALSCTTWLYARVYKVRTMETGSSLTLSGITFVIIFMVMYIIAGLINK